MNDMNLIMEGWRQYSSAKKESTIFLLEHNDPYRVNFNLILEERKIEDAVKLWESSSEYELDNLLTELKLAGAAKQLASKVGQKINDFIFKLSMQAFFLLQKGAKMAKKVASMVKKLTDTVKKYCGKYPIVCKIAKISAIVIAIFAISAIFFSPEAQAAISKGDAPMQEDTYNFLRGFLMDNIRDKTVGGELEKAADFIDIVGQLDKIQASPDVTQYEDLRQSFQGALNAGADFYGYLSDSVDKGDLTPAQFNKITEYYKTLGDTASATAEIITGPGSKSVRLSVDTAAAGPRPF
tara:strand:- start:135 stop:1019 length:885 start_codon:yes stop_codon:yes gene_type:complete